MKIVAVFPMSMVRRYGTRPAPAECENVHHDKGKNDRYRGDACGDRQAAALGERSVNVADDEDHTGHEQDACENQ